MYNEDIKYCKRKIQELNIRKKKYLQWSKDAETKSQRDYYGGRGLQKLEQELKEWKEHLLSLEVKSRL